MLLHCFSGQYSTPRWLRARLTTSKSNAVYQMLAEAYKYGIPFLVIEPAKGEYKDVFSDYDNILVYGTNPKKAPLLRINLFSFPNDVHVLEHIDRLVEIFYEKNNLPKPIIEQKVAAFSRHSDIAEEFEQWIADRTYIAQGAVVVEGYTAKKLSELSEYLYGDGAFILLIELREQPDKALKRIMQGFKRK